MIFSATRISNTAISSVQYISASPLSKSIVASQGRSSSPTQKITRTGMSGNAATSSVKLPSGMDFAAHRVSGLSTVPGRPSELCGVFSLIPHSALWVLDSVFLQLSIFVIQ